MTNSEAVRNITFRVPAALADSYKSAVAARELDVSKALRLHMRETVAAASDDEQGAKAA